ncbi:MAG: inner rane transport permease [Planctomycetaceae bacterium]|nr:inner rane transport permease [Planctomycetaceae bacterium]
MPATEKDSQPGLFRPAWTLAQRELIRFFRQRSRVIGAFGQPLLFWILFGAGLKNSFQAPDWSQMLGRPLSYQEYFFPGVAVMIVLFTAIFSTISIIEDRKEGFLQGVLVSPVSRLAIVLGKLTGGMCLSLIQAGIFLALAPLMGIQANLLQWSAIFGFLALLAFTLTALGFVMAWPLDSTQGYHALMIMLLMPMWLLSGAFFPGGESGWLSWLMRLNPLTYGVAALRRLLYWDYPLPVSAGLPSMGVSLLVTVIFASTCIGLSVALVSRQSERNVR